jgi:hypothetical protein
MVVGRRLDDDLLAEEIELYGELVVAASEAGDDGALLSQARIDQVLGLVD